MMTVHYITEFIDRYVIGALEPEEQAVVHSSTWIAAPHAVRS